MSEEKLKRKSLGKGLGALLGDDDVVETREIVSGGIGRNVDTACLARGDVQPRQDFDQEQLEALAESIRQNGILQPILVRPKPEEEGTYEIIAGERRWRAAQLAELKQVPVIIKEMTDAKALGIALIENIQREDLSPIEEAEGYQRLMDELKYTQDQISEIIGKSRSHIANTLRLNALPQQVKNLIKDGKITAGHGRALVNNERAVELAEAAVKKGLNVRQMERLVRKSDRPVHSTTQTRVVTKLRTSVPNENFVSKDEDVLLLEQEIQDVIGLPVNIVAMENNSGEIRIPFRSLEDFDNILQRLGNLREGM